MNMRRVRLGIDLFTGLVVASVGVALAGLTWRLAGNTGAAPVAAATASTTGEPVDIGGLLALAPFGTAAATSDVASNGSLHLKGIMLAVPASQSAALIAGADGKVASYGIGAALGGGVVETIAADQVILRTPHGLQAIGFTPAAGGPLPASLNAASAGFAPPGGPPPTPAGPPAAPGFQIGNSAPPALLAAGLQPGDTVVEVNGLPVGPGTSPDLIQRNLTGAALRGVSPQVVVLRNGNRVSLHPASH